MLQMFFKHLNKLSSSSLPEIEKIKEEIKKFYEHNEQFLAHLSHEIKTPLHSILGFCELLTTEKLTPRQKNYVKNISTSANYLFKLVNDILNLSKINLGKMQTCKTLCDSKCLINEVINSMQVISERKNLKIELKLIAAKVETDCTCLQQILFNLIGNAIKFSPEGGKVKVETKIIKKDKLQVKITDNGEGIEEKDSDKIFNQFAEISTPYTKNNDGTGLGLILTKKLVELLEGKIYFKSKPNKETSFFVEIPKVIKEN